MSPRHAAQLRSLDRLAEAAQRGLKMNISDLEKLLLAQGVVTLFAVIAAYVKLRQDFRQYARQQLFSIRLDRLRRQLSEFYGPIHMLAVANERIAKVAWGTGNAPPAVTTFAPLS